MASSTQKRGKLDEAQFVKTFSSVLDRSLSQEQLLALFMKVCSWADVGRKAIRKRCTQLPARAEHR